MSVVVYGELTLEVRFRMTGETVSQVLDRILGEGQGLAPSPSIMERNSNPGRWRTGPIDAACNSTLFALATRRKRLH